MACYRLRITTLSEVHIGDGQVLRREFEFAVHAGRFYRISIPRLLARYTEEPTADVLDRLVHVPPARWLDPEDFRHPELFPYILPGDPRVGEVRSFIKNPWFQPYIPGSSLKGALRTAILWSIWREWGQRLGLQKLDRRREWAGQPIERAWLGQDPNHDLLRVLRPRDSQPVEASQALTVVRAVVQVGNRQAAPISVEALRPDTTLTMTLVLDEGLLEIGEQRLGWKDRGKYLRNLAAVARNFALDRIRKEQAWAQTWGLGALQSFYAALRTRLDHMREEKGGRFLLRIGWGGGWESKTLGREPFDDQTFEELLRRYIRPRGRRQRGDPFPKSRRVVVDEQGRPLRPFGWVEVVMELAR